MEYLKNGSSMTLPKKKEGRHNLPMFTDKLVTLNSHFLWHS